MRPGEGLGKVLDGHGFEPRVHLIFLPCNFALSYVENLNFLTASINAMDAAPTSSLLFLLKDDTN